MCDRPKANYLLNAVPTEQYAHLLANLEPVTLALGQCLHEPGHDLSYVYFPIDCIVSLLHVMNNSTSAEIAVVGYEGVVGVSSFMGDRITHNRAVIQNAGTAYRLKASVMQAAFDEGGPLQKGLLCYTQALIAQMSQTAACNRHHTLEQQLCRWVLLTIDRMRSDEMKMTEELVANMLGIRLGSVSEITEKLQFARLITYTDGRIAVLNRAELEILVCECYGVVEAEYERLLSGIRLRPTLVSI